MHILILITVGTFVLGGCGRIQVSVERATPEQVQPTPMARASEMVSHTPAPKPTSAATLQPTNTPEPTSTPTPIPPTDTPIPPTTTPTSVPPTPTPTPTANRLAHLSGVILLDDRDENLLAVAADGSSERRLEVKADGEFAMSPDSATIVHEWQGRIFQVDISTGAETLITDLGKETYIENLTVSLDGKRLAYTDYGTVYVLDIASGQEELVYSSQEAQYMGGLTGHCEVHYLIWTDASKLLLYVGHKPPDAIHASGYKSGDHLTISCDDRLWHEVDTRTGKTQQLDQVSQFSREFQRVLEDTYWMGDLSHLSPDGLKYAYEKGSLYIAGPDGKAHELEGIRGIFGFEWSFDSQYIIHSGGPHESEDLWIVPADLSEPPMKFRKCRCVPRLWVKWDAESVR